MTGSGAKADAIRLNLGCGDDYRKGWVNVNIDPSFDPDVVLDLEESPWPWADDQFERILLDNVLEHIVPPRRIPFLNECRRVLRDGGEMIVRLPTRTGWDVTHHAVPAYTWPNHPTHRDQWDILEVSIDRIDPGYLMPKILVLFCTRYDVVRCVRQVEVRLG